MEIKIKALTEDIEVLNAARMTVWKGDMDKQPSEKFMYDIYMSEHSPIRDKWFVVEITGIKSWIATHFVRHSVGFTPYVSTQRDDRIDYMETTRDDAPQGKLVNIRMTLNAQSVINLSRKRLCLQSHLETVTVWKQVVEEFRKIDAPLAHHCVPNCIYRNGICPEPHCCGFNKTTSFGVKVGDYIERIVDNVSIRIN